MTKLSDYWRIYKANGFKRVSDELFESAFYDLIYGVDTQTYKPIKKYTIVDETLECSYQYQATYTSVVRKSLKRAWQFLDKPTSFLDAGCGKGKVLLEALRYNFSSVHGVEIDPELSKIAINNLKKRFPKKTNYNLFTGNIIDFTMPEDLGILFLFNPFNETILKVVVEKLEKLSLRTKRKILVVYVNPLHAELFSRWKVLHREKKFMQNSLLLQFNEDT